MASSFLHGRWQQIVGSLPPNSATAERVFSLLKLMFGDIQMQALTYMINSGRTHAQIQPAQGGLSAGGLSTVATGRSA
eukprot:7273940-Prymnesium_polylepis.1